MGKAHNHRLPVLQQQSSTTFICQRCPMCVYRLFSCRCGVVFFISVAAFLSALFLVRPLRIRQAGFDAKNSIKLGATVQAYFRLKKPVSELVPYISRLEYDVNGEIGVYSSKVVVLSMHQAGVSNWTNVVFGFLPDPVNSKINPVSLSVLKSSLIDLFFQQYNLTLTSSIFGEPSSFEILKFPGGITIIPEQFTMIFQIHQVFFNFTLNSSIYEIKENLQELKEQLKLGLHLMLDEVVLIQVTNKHGSTKDPPITVDASVVSNIGTLLPERLRQLAQIIIGSPTENLGLDHSVFGKVKEISLSSFLNHSLHAPTPTPSPSQSPEQSYDNGQSLAPSYSPPFLPNFHDSPPPCPNCFTSAPSASHPSAPTPCSVPHYFSSPTPNSPAPSVAQGRTFFASADPRSPSPTGDSPAPFVTHGSAFCGSADSPSPSPTSHLDQVSPNVSPCASSESPLAGSTPLITPWLSPLPGAVYSSSSPDKRSGSVLVSPPHVSSPLAFSQSYFAAETSRIRWFT